MEVNFAEKFEKQLDTVLNKLLLQKIAKIVQKIIAAGQIRDIRNLKK